MAGRGSAQRTAGRGSLYVEMGTRGLRAGSQTTFFGILGEKRKSSERTGGSGSVVLVREKKEITEKMSVSVGKNCECK